MKQEPTSANAAQAAPSLLPALVSSLYYVVLERRKLGNFNVLGEVPEWFPRLFPEYEAHLQNHQLGQLSHFLENFLLDAERLWQVHTLRQLRSGLWVETDENGQEYFLEATALFVQNRRLLLIQSLGSLFEDRQSMLQRARENSLEYMRVVEEMEQKDLLLHSIIHDMSGPLAGLKGYLDLLTKEQLSPTGKEFLEICQKQAARLDKLVHEILDAFSADLDLDQYTTVSQQEAPDMLATTIDVIKSLLSTAFLNKINLQLSPDTNHTADWKVFADKSRLERVLFNLIGNALWHSSEGGTVMVELTYLGDRVQVRVNDQGAGIPPENVGMLFQKFTQGKEKRGKLGLGLYFCRVTIEHWGGKIGYEPRAEGGSSFWFELPAPVREAFL